MNWFMVTDFEYPRAAGAGAGTGATSMTVDKWNCITLNSNDSNNINPKKIMDDDFPREVTRRGRSGR